MKHTYINFMQGVLRASVGLLMLSGTCVLSAQKVPASKKAKTEASKYEMKEVSGTVYDIATKEPMAGVRVQALNNRLYTAMTDENGNYTIKVPTAYHTLYEEGLVNNKGVPYVENLTFDVTVLDDASKAGTKIGEAKGITAPSDRVEKVVLFEKLDLEYSYDGLPSGINSFPRLKFSMSSRQTGSAGSPKCMAMNIYKIIIEPYR